MNIIRSTKYLDDGRLIESEIERRGDKVRLRLRLVDAAGFVVAAFRRTFDLLRDEEPIPAEFGRDRAVRRAVFDPVEELWRHRLRGLGGPGW